MIHKIHIQGFKSLVDVTVDLEPVTVLIGRSGTGKSNFVDAVRFLRDVLINRNVGVIINHYGGIHRLSSMTLPNKQISFTVDFSVPGITGDYRYHLAFSHQHNSIRHSEEGLTLNEKPLFHYKDMKWTSKPPITGIPDPAAIMLGSISGVQEIIVAYLALTSGIGCYDFPSTVLQGQHHVLTNLSGLSDHGENCLQIIDAITSNLQALSNWKEITSALRSLNNSIKGIGIKLPEKNQIDVTHELSNKLLIFNVEQESEGFRRFLAQLVALYQSPPKQFMVFEEPEKGIHPGALATLAEEFQASPEAGRGQVVITTHSPQLLNNFSPNTLRVVDIHNHVTVIGPVAHEQIEAIKENLLRSGELLTVDQARIDDNNFNSVSEAATQ